MFLNGIRVKQYGSYCLESIYFWGVTVKVMGENCRIKKRYAKEIEVNTEMIKRLLKMEEIRMNITEHVDMLRRE